MQKIADLENDIQKCFAPIEQPLREGVDEAKKSYNKTISSLLKVGVKRCFCNPRTNWFGKKPQRSACA